MWELQIEKRAQGKGLGRFLVQIMELLAIKHKMPCIMLTVFHINTGATAFYKKLNYVIDETSPSKDINYVLSNQGYDFEVMSKSFRR